MSVWKLRNLGDNAIRRLLYWNELRDETDDTKPGFVSGKPY